MDILENRVREIVHEEIDGKLEELFEELKSGGFAKMLANEFAERFADEFMQKCKECSGSNTDWYLWGGEKVHHKYDDHGYILKEAAEEDLQALREVLENSEDHVAMVDDWYCAIDVEPDISDAGFGWTNLDDAKVVECNGRWYIDLPEPEEI